MAKDKKMSPLDIANLMAGAASKKEAKPDPMDESDEIETQPGKKKSKQAAAMKEKATGKGLKK